MLRWLSATLEGVSVARPAAAPSRTGCAAALAPRLCTCGRAAEALAAWWLLGYAAAALEALASSMPMSSATPQFEAAEGAAAAAAAAEAADVAGREVGVVEVRRAPRVEEDKTNRKGEGPKGSPERP